MSSEAARNRSAAVTRWVACRSRRLRHHPPGDSRTRSANTVLRDGRRIGSAPAAELPQDRLIQWMVGRPMTSLFPRHMPTLGDEVLGVKDFSVFPQGPAHPAAVRQVSFAVRAGEIVGIGGLHGSGASELLGGIFGAYGSHTQGQLWLGGRR